MIGRTELTTDRALLRPFRFGDVEDVFAYASDEDWGRQLLNPVPSPYTRTDAEEFIARSCLASWDARVDFAIQLGERVVGGIGLSLYPDNKLAELGYGLAKAHWGAGLMPEVGHAVIDWAFGTYDLVKIYARIDAGNRQSIRVAQKLGMSEEALLRKHRYRRGEHVDVAWYGLLKHEWEEDQR